MLPEQKAMFLERRRLQYAAKKRRLLENCDATCSNQTYPSAEPQNRIFAQPALHFQDNPSISRNGVQSRVPDQDRDLGPWTGPVLGDEA
ncbi:hypothetical protein HAX54_028522 [Datura stramonium]|uniref:Uncharacterized protein n=1 Tax=Datura stramonium TaxID=4076 RepID=A0ABS8V6W1_DATST|nr:hypothetical protein [Datura stramonium]